MDNRTYSTGPTSPLPYRDIAALPEGCAVESDGDGDWLLIPPEDVQIFSEPGEDVLLGAETEREATDEAIGCLRAVSRQAGTPDGRDGTPRKVGDAS